MEAKEKRASIKRKQDGRRARASESEQNASFLYLIENYHVCRDDNAEFLKKNLENFRNSNRLMSKTPSETNTRGK